MLHSRVGHRGAGIAQDQLGDWCRILPPRWARRVGKRASTVAKDAQVCLPPRCEALGETIPFPSLECVGDSIIAVLAELPQRVSVRNAGVVKPLEQLVGVSLGLAGEALGVPVQ